MKPKVVFLVGPTAVGKTKLAIELAKTKNFEIISADSMQVYKGFKILSAQPLDSVRKHVPYHLVGILSPREEYNVAKFRKEALRLIKQIHSRGKIPLIVGGSGLYISVLRDGIFELPAKDAALRRRLMKEADKRGIAHLFRRLKRVDLQAASKIHPNDLRRIVRALEVYQLSKRPISQWQRQRRGLDKDYAVYIFGLNCDRQKLYKNIDQRVDGMFKQGLVREAKRLLKQKLSRTASFAIGLREIKGWLAGEYDLAEAKRLMKRNSRRFAKRQMSWFRRDNQIRWLNTEEFSPKQIAQKILQRL